MKKLTTREWLFVGIGTAALVLTLLFIFRKVHLPGSDPLYKRLQDQNDSLLTENNKKDSRIKQIDKRVDSLTSVIEKNDERIQYIPYNVERKVLVYDTFTVEQLDSFFSERYP